MVATTLLSTPRVAQEVRVVTTAYGSGMGPRFVVLITPAGSERGEYYDVLTRRALDMLREGRATPEDLELELSEVE